MIKLVYCIRRREDVPEDEFHRYWLDEHGPLVRSVADAIGAVRYVQSHTVLYAAQDRCRRCRCDSDKFWSAIKLGATPQRLGMGIVFGAFR
jgi:EthD domain